MVRQRQQYGLQLRRLEYNEKVLIGAPIANTYIRILDKDNMLVPVGVSGEILIGGTGLARGYFNREELTAEKFITDPFSADPMMRAHLIRINDLIIYLY